MACILWDTDWACICLRLDFNIFIPRFHVRNGHLTDVLCESKRNLLGEVKLVLYQNISWEYNRFSTSIKPINPVYNHGYTTNVNCVLLLSIGQMIRQGIFLNKWRLTMVHHYKSWFTASLTYQKAFKLFKWLHWSDANRTRICCPLV